VHARSVRAAPELDQHGEAIRAALSRAKAWPMADTPASP